MILLKCKKLRQWRSSVRVQEVRENVTARFNIPMFHQQAGRCRRTRPGE
jgi:hypothetical protein